MINKLSMKSRDIFSDNVNKISKLFPNCISEGKINFEMLKQELSKDIIEDGKEKYQLTWVGKKEAILNSNTSIHKTLRPIRNKSVDFDNTKNIYIEGDNLEALKILQNSYLNKIQCIYIDPPYNTGRNLIYKNDFSKDENNELLESGQINEYGEKMIYNLETNGRFHSDWLSMIYSRIKLARNLLSNDGIIIVAIDDNEEANLQKICDEIFGENNFIGKIVTRSNPQGRGKKNIDPCHEYHLVYSKSFECMPDLKVINRQVNAEKNYKNFLRSGTNSRKNERPFRFYPMLLKNEKVYCISSEDYRKIFDVKNRKFNEEEIKMINKKYTELGYKVIWPIAQNGEEKVWQRTFERAVKEADTYIYIGNQIKTPGDNYRTPMSLWNDDIYSNVAYGTNSLNALFDNNKVFDYSKSLYTVMDMISLGKNDIVLDFFSGSATTANAVMQLNAEDSGNRRFIMIQIPEIIDENSDAKKFGYNTICDVGENRIKKCAQKIKEETNADIDYGFKVYKIDSSNMKDVYYAPKDLQQSQLNMFESNVKEDRTAEDLLTQVILDLGVTLDLSIEEKKILSNNVYFVESNSLVACFDDVININIIDEICKCNPLKIVFKESSFKTDSDKINIFERIKKLSPETEVNVI